MAVIKAQDIYNKFSQPNAKTLSNQTAINLLAQSSKMPTTLYNAVSSANQKIGAYVTRTPDPYVMANKYYQSGLDPTSPAGIAKQSGTASDATDYTAYNAELLRKYNQSLVSSDLEKSQLAENYKNALAQYQTQENDVNASATNLGQQAYISKMQSERLNPNALEAQGLANTGYKDIAKQKIGTAWRASYASILADQQQQLNSINQNKTNTTTSYNQNLASIELARKQAYEDYLASKK